MNKEVNFEIAKLLNKSFWVVLFFVWVFPEFIYMAITKEPSKISKFIYEKLGL